MEPYIFWMIIILLFVLLILFNNKHILSAPLRDINKRLRALADKVDSGQSSGTDITEWERCLAFLETRPSEFNKLEMEIRIRAKFATYLERHYPNDPRLPYLQEIASHPKDTIWGMKINMWDKK
ncbi:hypothetical protein EJP77_01635 [Paenibacillus zeisoli]|uniref:Uncharacterized protein n=1 Tax=Paenibacillus zeisoli TaxID=2496267 RepID=A0A433XNV3_9BACL|nr:hypothetical protein [Paenibacillus zeisoli]RUT35746.1 hypothetical protein EJP77_01635 [Paenibacillus zeisoli]